MYMDFSGTPDPVTAHERAMIQPYGVGGSKKKVLIGVNVWIQCWRARWVRTRSSTVKSGEYVSFSL